jgi:hypothetical protein
MYQLIDMFTGSVIAIFESSAEAYAALTQFNAEAGYQAYSLLEV